MHTDMPSWGTGVLAQSKKDKFSHVWEAKYVNHSGNTSWLWPVSHSKYTVSEMLALKLFPFADW